MADLSESHNFKTTQESYSRFNPWKAMQSPKFYNTSPSHKVSPSFKNGETLNNTISTIAIAHPNTPSSNSQSSLFTNDDIDRLSSFYDELTLEKEALRAQMTNNDTEINNLSKKLLEANVHKETLSKAQQRIFLLENRMIELAQDGSNSKRNANGEKIISGYSNINIEAAASFSQRASIVMKKEPEKVPVEPQLQTIDDSDSHIEDQTNQIPSEEEIKELKEKVEELSNMLNKSEESKESLWEIIENKDNLIKQLEAHVEGLKKNYSPLIEDLKKRLLTFSVKNQELCTSLQEKVSEISKLKENLNNTDIFKQQLFISNEQNEDLKKDIQILRDQIKAKDLELEQKEQNLALTLDKYNNLQMIVRQSAQENQAYKTSIQQLEMQYSNLRETITVSSPRTPIKSKMVSTPKEKDTKDLRETKAKMAKVDELEKKIVVLSARKDKLTKENNDLTNLIKNKRQQQISNKAKQTSTRSCSSKDDLDHQQQLNVSQLMTEWDDEETKEEYQYRISKVSTMAESTLSAREKPVQKNVGDNIKRLDFAMDRLKDVEKKLVAIINKASSLKFEDKSKMMKEHFVKKSVILEDWRESIHEIQQIFSEMGDGDENNKSNIPNFEAVCGSTKSIHDDSFVVFSGSNSLEAL